MRARLKLVLLLAALVGLAGLVGQRLFPDPDGFSRARAERLVRAYNERLIEAFRAGDARAVEGVAGPEEARKIASLIDVKLDQSLSLDSKLLDIELDRFEHEAGQAFVETRERWSYRDRRIGTGEQVGNASEDRYHMRYHLKRLADLGWRVVRVEFVARPVVGRAAAPGLSFHGEAAATPTPTATPAPSTRSPGGER